MLDRVGRIRAGWSGDAAVCAFAALLAFGTLAWEEALHALVLAPAPADGGFHFVRDGLLLLPLWVAELRLLDGCRPRGASLVGKVPWQR